MADAQTILGQSRNVAFDGTVYRNICSLVVSQDLFDDIADPEDFAMAQAIEEYAKPPHFVSHQPIIHRPFEEADWNDSVDYPFENWQESRFSTGKFGVWYGSSDLMTGVYETAYHWIKRMIDEDGHWTDGRIAQRKVYSVDLKAVLIDLRPTCKKVKALTDKNDYTLTQSIGKVLSEQGHPGLLSKSARCDGDIQAIFTPRVLSNPKVSCWFEYRIEGDQVIASSGSNTRSIHIKIDELVA
ncbi:MAG TPA: RES family NAD+ phosphorylase [Limnobacter sp.]|nr:RES family NAD+ phosphorylase [Limnobacter sp.]